MTEPNNKTSGSSAVRLGWASLALATVVLYMTWDAPHARDSAIETFLSSPSFSGLLTTFAFLVGSNIFTLIPLTAGSYAFFGKKNPQGLTIILLSLLVFVGISVRHFSASTSADNRSEKTQPVSNTAEFDRFPTTPGSPSIQDFVTIKLPRDVLLEIPRKWAILSNDDRIDIQSTAESILDFSKLHQTNPEYRFAAIKYDNQGKESGRVGVVYYPTLEATQSVARNASPSNVADLDRSLRSGVTQAGASVGFKIASWDGTSKQNINGLVALVTSYRRVALNGNDAFRVRMVQVLAASRSFTMTISYRESDQLTLRPVCDRIISSVKMVN